MANYLQKGKIGWLILIFRNIKISEHEKVKSFFEVYYGNNYCEVDKKYFDWLHKDNPFIETEAAQDEYTSFAAIENNEILSCINYVPFDMYVDSKPYRSTWSVGWLTQKNNSVISGLLLKKNFSRFNFYMSMGATNWVKTIYTTQFGFEYNHNIPRVVQVINSEKTEYLLRRNAENHLEDISKIYEWGNHSKRISKNRTHKLIDKISEIDEEYWNHHLKSNYATMCKNKKYLKWRYLDHPDFNYSIITGSQGVNIGYAVLRLEKVRDSDVSVSRMLDFLPMKGHSKDLLEAVTNFLFEHDVAFMDFFCGSESFLRNNLSDPIIFHEEHHRFRFPRMFQPLEWRERYSINGSFGINSKQKKNLPQISLDQIYFTKGDPSQDILLNREYVTKGL